MEVVFCLLLVAASGYNLLTDGNIWTYSVAGIASAGAALAYADASVGLAVVFAITCLLNFIVVGHMATTGNFYPSKD